MEHPELKRLVKYLYVPRQSQDSVDISEAIPKLCEPQLVTFSSSKASVFSGFEEIGEERYYQSWVVQWS